MSFFYMSPAKGDIPFHLLEKIVSNRLLYLDGIHKGDLPLYNEYLVEGSAYDNVGHYMLCVLAILANNSEFKIYLQETEEKLFQYRLTSISAYDLRILVKKVLRCIKKQDTDIIYTEPLFKLCQYLNLKHVTHHITTTCHQTCCLFTVKVKFKHCLKFVSQRKVELKYGVACIPCNMWKNYIVDLFSDNLKRKLFTKGISSLHLLKNDPRIEELLENFKNRFQSSKSNINSIKSTEVDRLSNYFPPCMKNLHENLRKKHRLSHHQRFNYSLFLKDIGMPIDEAMKFWKNEYDQVPQGTSVCCHTWQRDEKKYIYGIRHMYGLEGGRKIYTSGTCSFIQNLDNSNSEGGCPFKSFDISNMQKVLELSENNSEWTNIYQLNIKKQYTSACLHFLKYRHLMKLNCDILTINFSPMKYYSLASINKL